MWTGVACRQSPPTGGEPMGTQVVAMVAGRAVTKNALEKEMARRGPGSRKEAVLDELIRFEATLTKARASGFDRDPEIVNAMERVLVARFEERELGSVEFPAVAEDEIRARHAADAARYRSPPAVRGAVLFLKCSPRMGAEQRAAVASLAETLRTQLATADAATIGRLARENSEDQATRYQGGDTGWIPAGLAGGALEPAVIEALFALDPPGAAARVIETPRGYHVARLMATRPAATRPLAEVRDVIRHQMALEKREQRAAAFRERMRAGLDIRTNRLVFDAIPAVPTGNAAPPPLP